MIWKIIDAVTLVLVVAVLAAWAWMWKVGYVQVPYDRPAMAKHPCRCCVAACNFPLCDMLCPYCKERVVFQRKVAGKQNDRH